MMKGIFKKKLQKTSSPMRKRRSEAAAAGGIGGILGFSIIQKQPIVTAATKDVKVVDESDNEDSFYN